MRVAVTGATGNIGTGVVAALRADPQVGTVAGLARRPAEGVVTADVERDDLVPHFRGADVVVHLAWLFQPARSPERTWRANVLGSMRVFDAMAAAGVPKLVYTSSIGAYSPRTDDEPVTEDWPTHGWPGAACTREKLIRSGTWTRSRPGTRNRPSSACGRGSCSSAPRRPNSGGSSPGPSSRARWCVRACSRWCRTSAGCVRRSCTQRISRTPFAGR